MWGFSAVVARAQRDTQLMDLIADRVEHLQDALFVVHRDDRGSARLARPVSLGLVQGVDGDRLAVARGVSAEVMNR